MKREERLKRYLLAISEHEGGVESIAPAEGPPMSAASADETESMVEGVAPEAHDEAVKATVDTANAALDKVKLKGLGADLAPEEMNAIEAIIIPDKRPAIDIVDDRFTVTHRDWLDLNADGDADIHERLLKAIPAVGRVELPGQNRIPYGGTGFIVGSGLVMTNRHVAAIFADGLGGPLEFRRGWQSAVDFRRERGRPAPASDSLRVRRVRMIHPYWDMALLEVEGLPESRGHLSLSLADVGDLDGRRIAVIGYPAFDPERNDVAVQNKLFSGVYGVKRLQPGRLTGRRDTASFAKLVSAATHDCSTLGGNSGSAVIDLDTGEVLGLHFGGRYLETNYCVPAFELAKDGRVVDAGVKFAGTPAGGVPPWKKYWEDLESAAATPTAPTTRDNGDRGAAAVSPSPHAVTTVNPGSGAVTFTVPLTITVQLGTPAGLAAGAQEAVASIEEKLAEVWHDPDYDDRTGYDENFLGVSVPMPKATDPSVVAPLLDGTETLHYRNFSVQMHAQRRIALFCASNVTAEPALKKPEPGRKYDRRSLSGLGPNDHEKWFPDPRMAAEFQLSDRFYTKDRGAFDKGHIVRREDAAHGPSYDLLRQGNGDTYHITNCSPQVAQFNQSQRGQDNWGDLENLVLGEAASERLCIFSGPVLDASDQIFAGVDSDGDVLRLRIPKAFWKVVVAKRNDSEIMAYAFVLDQDLSNVELELAVPEAFRKRMVSIEELERRTGIEFPQEVRDADQFEDLGIELAFRAGIERTAVIDEGPESGFEQVTPNTGDDEEAADAGAVAPFGTEEAPRPWRLAEALKVLRAQVNAAAPGRSKVSDGSIGDRSHQGRSSDHNAWVIDGASGVVTAIDITHDPRPGGFDAGVLAENLRASADKRIKYIIWNRRIANREPINGAAAWAWRPYSGRNPHNHHVHISVRPQKVHYDARDPWRI